MKTTCITHPSNEPLIVIRDWQRRFCSFVKTAKNGKHELETNLTAATLLSVFEYWHNVKLRQQEEKIALAKAKKEVYEVSQTDLYQFHTLEDLQKRIFDIGGRNAVIEARKMLAERGVITEHENPNDAFKFDNTIYYLFHPEILNEWIADEQKLTPFKIKLWSFKIKRWEICDKNPADHSLILNDGGFNFKPTITKITYKENITTEVDSESEIFLENSPTIYCDGEILENVRHDKEQTQLAQTNPEAMPVKNEGTTLQEEPIVKTEKTKIIKSKRERKKDSDISAIKNAPLPENYDQEVFDAIKNFCITRIQKGVAFSTLETLAPKSQKALSQFSKEAVLQHLNNCADSPTTKSPFFTNSYGVWQTTVEQIEKRIKYESSQKQQQQQTQNIVPVKLEIDCVKELIPIAEKLGYTAKISDIQQLFKQVKDNFPKDTTNDVLSEKTIKFLEFKKCQDCKTVSLICHKFGQLFQEMVKSNKAQKA